MEWIIHQKWTTGADCEMKWLVNGLVTMTAASCSMGGLLDPYTHSHRVSEMNSDYRRAISI
jgi:hypothetical protein